ncbi:hypothetical protein B0H11DRAFT_2032108 [Mycena galericulata]|nr:hypothetical protein B0H11DRAFT_2032108 [Mycena galericulata]
MPLQFPTEASTWLNPSAPSNVAMLSPNTLPTSGPGEHSTTFSDPWRGKACAENGDVPWLESPSVDALANGFDAVSAAFLLLIEAHGCGSNPEVISLLRPLLCNSYLPREELLDVVDWPRLLRLSSRVFRCAALSVPSTTSSPRSKLDRSPNSLTTNASTTLSDLYGVYHSAEFLPPADTTPRIEISDYELHDMQPLSMSSFSNGLATPVFPSGALGMVPTASTISSTTLTISPTLLMQTPTILFHPSTPESPPKTPPNSPEPPTQPELHHSPKRRCIDCQVEHTKQWRKHPELPGYLCNPCGQHQAKHKSPRSQEVIRRERARANDKYAATVPTRPSSPPEKRGGEVIMRIRGTFDAPARSPTPAKCN